MDNDLPIEPAGGVEPSPAFASDAEIALAELLRQNLEERLLRPRAEHARPEMRRRRFA